MWRKLRAFDYVGFAATAALIAVGTLAIYSAGSARSAFFHGIWIDNLQTAAFGLVLYLALAFTDYRRYLDPAAVVAYAVSLAMLVAVLVFGTEVLGARRWLWFFQPSEVAKLCAILLAASLFGQEGAWGLGRLRGFGGFALATALFALPAALILAEPDLGTTLALVPAAIVILYAARVWRRGLLPLLAVGGIAALAVLGAVYEAEKPGVLPERRERILKYVPLRPHQVARVKTYLFPESNSDGAGWNLKQSKIAIGSGGWRGKGLGRGDQSHLKYLPPAGVMNDFIFCVWGGGDRLSRHAHPAGGVRRPLPLRLPRGVYRRRRTRTPPCARRDRALVRARVHQSRHVGGAAADHRTAAAVHFFGTHLPGDGDVRPRFNSKCNHS